ncbi:peptide deformylase [Corynebacterium sp. SA-MJD20WY100]|uniref:peptide deformylase n=1 Tax=Corynebacterium TaxID=1716 RepID=UPI0032220C67
MSIRDIRIYGDPVLTSIATPFDTFDSSLERLANDMLETMEDAGGVGLAANQIGLTKRIFVYDCSHVQPGMRGALVNPVWQPLGDMLQVGPEGCLSIPDISAETVRHETVRVSGFDVFGRPVGMVVSGLMARCVQHETDHLDGVLFLDRLHGDVRKQAMAEVRASDWFNA